MARKKLSEMTPFERVSQRMKGLSNEEAEEVALMILAQILAKHMYVFKDTEEYFDGLMKRLSEATNKYRLEHSYELALGAVMHKRELSGEHPFNINP